MRPALDCIEVLREGAPLPRDALGHCRAGDVFDALHQLNEPFTTVGLRGGEANSAVAHHDAGDAVPRRRREPWVPTHLCVVVSVNVDPARGEQQTVGIDGAPGVARRRSAGFVDAGNAVACDADVGHSRVGTRPIDESCVANDQIGHGVGPMRRITSLCIRPFELTAELDSKVRTPSRSVNVPPACSTTTCSAARSYG